MWNAFAISLSEIALIFSFDAVLESSEVNIGYKNNFFFYSAEHSCFVQVRVCDVTGSRSDGKAGNILKSPEDNKLRPHTHVTSLSLPFCAGGKAQSHHTRYATAFGGQFCNTTSVNRSVNHCTSWTRHLNGDIIHLYKQNRTSNSRNVANFCRAIEPLVKFDEVQLRECVARLLHKNFSF